METSGLKLFKGLLKWISSYLFPSVLKGSILILAFSLKFASKELLIIIQFFNKMLKKDLITAFRTIYQVF